MLLGLEDKADSRVSEDIENKDHDNLDEHYSHNPVTACPGRKKNTLSHNICRVFVNKVIEECASLL